MAEEHPKYIVFGKSAGVFPAIDSNIENLTDLSAYFITRVNELLVDPINFTDNIRQDDVARKYQFTGKGLEDAYLDYGTEGNVGITFPNLPKRNSGFNGWGRMYFYNNIEPDYLFCYRIVENDEFLNKLNLFYDERYIACYCEYEFRSYGIYYYYFILDRQNDFEIVESYNRNVNVLNSSNTLLLDYKNYNREVNEWSPIRIPLLETPMSSNTKVKGMPYIVYIPYTVINKPVKKYNFKDTSFYDYNFLSKITNTISNFDTENYNIYSNLKMDSYLIDVFIEGAPSTQNIDIKIDGQSLSKTFSYTLKNNDLKTIDDIVIDKYIISNTERKYIREINIFDKPMVKGILNGIVNLKNCGSNLSNMKIMCYREYDGLLIGEYSINSDGAYFIDNLDYNTFYDIHLVDTSVPKILETQVSSHRQPTLKYPYTKLVAPNIINEVVYSQGPIYKINWEYEYNKDVNSIEKIKIYYSENPFNISDLKNVKFEYGDLFSYYISNKINKYFMIECINDDTRTYSKLIEIDYNNYSTIIVNGEYSA